MSPLPVVSIVTPSYNQVSFLEETILSVLKQDYPNIEYIIVDGGSDDGSLDIIKKYENRLAYWVSEKDRGQTNALIKGFARATGKYLGWLCSDDILEPSMVSISVDYHLRYPGIGLTYGDRIRIDAKGNIYSSERFPAFRHCYIRWGFSIPQETTLFRRDVYDSVGGLDESLKMAMDFDLWCKISNVFELLHIPAYLGRFRVHASNKSSIFTNQIRQTGFYEGNPAEYAHVYLKHFGRRPSTRLIRLEKIVGQLMAFYERRTSRYRENSEIIRKIRIS